MNMYGDLVMDSVPDKVQKTHSRSFLRHFTLVRCLSRQRCSESALSDLVSASSQVHFFNSFFYDKLRTKGYDGVKRWTKNVSQKLYTCVDVKFVCHMALLSVMDKSYLSNLTCIIMKVTFLF